MAAERGVQHTLHVDYFQRVLRGIAPPQFAGLDASRMTIAFFAVSGLDVLGALDELPAHVRAAVVEWVYSLQVGAATGGGADDAEDAFGGFRGGPSCVCGALDPSGPSPTHASDFGNLAMSYSTICMLLILGDDLSRVRRRAVLRAVGAMQEASGCFRAHPDGEFDMRFVFCAAAICVLLGDEACSAIDRARTLDYVVRSASYEGGFGLGPGQEAHGGSTYCALATLALLGALDALPHRAATVRWCLERQQGGFQGRANKDEDTCYGWWVGASLALLGHADLIEASDLSAFTCGCQFSTGGLCKFAGAPPDPLHSYFGLCALSIARATDAPGARALRELEPRLAITRRAWQARPVSPRAQGSEPTSGEAHREPPAPGDAGWARREPPARRPSGACRGCALALAVALASVVASALLMDDVGVVLRRGSAAMLPVWMAAGEHSRTQPARRAVDGDGRVTGGARSSAYPPRAGELSELSQQVKSWRRRAAGSEDPSAGSAAADPLPRPGLHLGGDW